jgi:hypothetical protein
MRVQDWRTKFLEILPMSSARLDKHQINILASELANTLHNRISVDINFGVDIETIQDD